LKGKDSSQGGSISLTRSFPFGDFSPFLGVGIWAATHTVSWVAWGENIHQSTPRSQEYSYNGILIGPMVTGGVCYKWVCAQVDYYKVMSHSGYPIAKDIMMPTVAIKIPLSVF